MSRVLIIATVQSHVGQFHKPLMRILKEHGWEIHVAARNNLLEKNGLKLEYPDKVYDVPFQRSPLNKMNIVAFRQLEKILKANHYDIIHCNTPVGGVLGRLAAIKYRKKGTKVYYTAHGFHFYKGAPIKNWIVYYPIERFMSRFTDKLITITHEDYALARKGFHCQVSYIHGVGADSSKYFPLSKEEQELKKEEMRLDGNIIISVGELLQNKNQKLAILALKKVMNKYPNTFLYIAGNGPEREKLEELVTKQELNSHVFFLGYTLDLHKYLKLCTLELACSYREGLPLNVIEAMLCGKPVVASHNRGHDELIEDGETGFLVQVDDVEGFANAIIQVLEEPTLYEQAALLKALPFKDTMVQQELKKIYEL